MPHLTHTQNHTRLSYCVPTGVSTWTGEMGECWRHFLDGSQKPRAPRMSGCISVRPGGPISADVTGAQACPSLSGTRLILTVPWVVAPKGHTHIFIPRPGGTTASGRETLQMEGSPGSRTSAYPDYVGGPKPGTSVLIRDTEERRRLSQRRSLVKAEQGLEAVDMSPDTPAASSRARGRKVPPLEHTCLQDWRASVPAVLNPQSMTLVTPSSHAPPCVRTRTHPSSHIRPSPGHVQDTHPRITKPQDSPVSPEAPSLPLTKVSQICPRVWAPEVKGGAGGPPLRTGPLQGSKDRASSSRGW